MNLTHVKNCQYFCLANNPCEIFKRICDYTRLVTNLQGNQEGRTQIECWDLAKGEEVIFYKPKITKVIPLSQIAEKQLNYQKHATILFLLLPIML